MSIKIGAEKSEVRGTKRDLQNGSLVTKIMQTLPNDNTLTGHYHNVIYSEFHSILYVKYDKENLLICEEKWYRDYMFRDTDYSPFLVTHRAFCYLFYPVMAK